MTCAFSIADLVACSSISIPSTALAPSFLARIDSIPLPLPASKTVEFSFKYFLRLRIQSFVVSWEPVPKDIPGSISMTRSFSLTSDNSSHVGLIRISSSMRNGLKNCFQLLSQSLSSVSEISMFPLPIETKLDNSLRPFLIF